jgi:GNAT superfamily N-acetyltransferase
MKAREFLKEAKSAKYNNLAMKYAFNDNALILKAFSKEGPLAFAKFLKEDQNLYPQHLFVHDDHQNKGIAKAMYDYLKSEGYTIHRSHDQTKAGAGFWDNHRGKGSSVWEEAALGEAPLPADWDPAQYRPGTTFKDRLAYALERAKKLGTGSSRVATIIEYQGRPTVLKIAKNRKGLAQNSVEASILEDWYAKKLDILIPLIDYDEQNQDPTWIHTEVANKATERQLCNLMKCDNLSQLVNMSSSIAKRKMFQDHFRSKGRSEEDIEIVSEYADKLYELYTNFDVELVDMIGARNWGIYNGKPVIIDIGFNTDVMKRFY